MIDPSDNPARRVLIVDDDKIAAQIVAGVLQRAGFWTVVAHTGADAIAEASAAPPAGAVLDIHLPDLNGLVLAMMLRRQLGPEAPLVMLSGDTSMETIRSLNHVGATYFISKPFNPARLSEILRKSLSTPHGAGHGPLNLGSA